MFSICVILGDTRMDTSAFSPGHTICDTLEKNTAFFFFGQEGKKTSCTPVCQFLLPAVPTTEQENVACISSEFSM